MTTDRPADSIDSSWEDCMELLDRLPGLPLEERATAIEKLLHNPSPGVRSRALQVGAAILSDDKLVEFLRDDADAVRRNFALQIFKIRGHRSFSLAVGLLDDEDPDVVLQAVLILDHIKDPRAFEPLRAALRHPDPNVVQEAIVAVGHLGDARAIQDLLPFLDAHDRLRGEVGDGHRALVLLLERLRRHQPLLHAATNPSRRPHRSQPRRKLRLVSHSLSPVIRGA